MGGALCRSAPSGVSVVGVIRSRPAPEGVRSRRCALDDPDDCRELVALERPDVVIHCAYSTADLRRDVVEASAAVAAACAESGAALVMMSTDVVFDGGRAPYAESATPAPVSAYGSAKLDAERATTASVGDAAIVRTSMVTSLDPLDGCTAWVLSAVDAGQSPTVFVDEWRCPIRLADLVEGIWRIAELPRAERAGVWHLVGPERLHRGEIARRVLDASGRAGAPIATASVRSFPEPRPADCALGIERARAAFGFDPSPIP